MTKKSTMYRGVLFEDFIDNYLNKESASICQFLHFLCLDDISQYVERIDHWVNKMWKKGGDVHAKMEEKLIFLYKNGRPDRSECICGIKIFRIIYSGACTRKEGNVSQNMDTLKR